MCTMSRLQGQLRYVHVVTEWLRTVPMLCCAARRTASRRAAFERSLAWQTCVLWYRGLQHRAKASPKPRLLLDGLVFGEGPRWHDGRLYLSDMHAGEVLAVGADGSRETIATMRDGTMCSGLGFLPDGGMLIVSMEDRSVLRLDPKADGGLTRWADLSGIATWHCNDMVVDARGRAYVGNFGWDIYADQQKVTPASLALIDEVGSAPARSVADGLHFPNGCAISADGTLLIVAETWGMRLTAFDIAPADGSLSNRRTWAKLPCVPDGICLDAAGCVWVANPRTPGYAIRVGEGGTILQSVPSDEDWGVYAVALGGAEGNTLYMVEAKGHDPSKTCSGNSRVRAVEVEVGRGGGRP